jgi:hypothetical protein
MTGITATISNRILAVEAADVVAGNDYPMTVTYDAEWSGTVYIRVRFGSYHYDIPTTVTAGTPPTGAATVQMPIGYPEVGIGIYSEALGICTNEARIKVTKCILESGTEPVEFDDALYEQWEGEVTSLLVDDAFDSTSDRPIANRVVAALDASALKKDLPTISQTVQGPLVLDGTVKAQSAWVHAAYGATSVSKGRYLKLFSFSRPSGTSALRLRVSYRESARYTVIELGGLHKSGDTAYGDIHAESSWADLNTYVLGYNSGSDSYEVYLHAGSTGSRSLVVTVEGAVSTATGSQIKVVGLTSTITNATSMSSGTEALEEITAVDTGFNLNMARTASDESYPNWRPIWEASVTTTQNTSTCGVFVVSITNPLGGYQYGLCQLSQRTTSSAPVLRFEWMCAAGIDPADYAIVQQDGVVQMWAKQTSRYQGPCAVLLTGWRNTSSLGTYWTAVEDPVPVADLPSGEGVYSALSILDGVQGGVSLSMGSGDRSAPDADPGAGEGQR